MVADFQIKQMVNRVRPSYKKLVDVEKTGVKNYATLGGLGKEFLVSKLRVGSILREAGLYPVGGVFSGKKGAPLLAYDRQAAEAAILAAV